uniref:Uncharacterized protein n=1 Tax=Leersia perrieri TaxID=77586 RepID=A0A0D9XTJ2_9ORYZ
MDQAMKSRRNELVIYVMPLLTNGAAAMGFDQMGIKSDGLGRSWKILNVRPTESNTDLKADQTSESHSAAPHGSPPSWARRVAGSPPSWALLRLFIPSACHCGGPDLRWLAPEASARRGRGLLPHPPRRHRRGQQHRSEGDSTFVVLLGLQISSLATPPPLALAVDAMKQAGLIRAGPGSSHVHRPMADTFLRTPGKSEGIKGQQGRRNGGIGAGVTGRPPEPPCIDHPGAQHTASFYPRHP